MKGISQDDVKNCIKNNSESACKKRIRTRVLFSRSARDDLIFYLNDKPVQKFWDLAKQRSTVLSLKLAEIELMNIATGEYPILLLDDVLSELDDVIDKHI